MLDKDNQIVSEDIKSLISDIENFKEKTDVFAEAMKHMFLQTSTNN